MAMSVVRAVRCTVRRISVGSDPPKSPDGELKAGMTSIKKTRSAKSARKPPVVTAPRQAAEPDAAEALPADEGHDLAPAPEHAMSPMVGIGGSAGAIPVLQAFFSAMPADSGLVFVVILHLAPAHESILPELLQRSTKMRVLQAADGMKVEPNCVYVIPPAKHLISTDGHLGLTDLQAGHGKRIAVDLFFRTLADSHGPHSVAIVLSGADGDGAIGIKRIKERGGLTIAQEPDEAEHVSMPRAAIATGMVDWVLNIAQMPERLLDYVARRSRLRLPAEDGPELVAAQRAPIDDDETALREVLDFLCTRTSRDFSYYKRASVLRRIARRMQVVAVDDLGSYLAYLRTQPGEAGALLQDMLISVTNFFRDRDAFAALAATLPLLFRDKKPADTVRIWVPGCATGEEAYSIAMLLAEHVRTLDHPPLVQIFATDLDDEALAQARDGLYPDAIAADVSDERLRRFFIKDHRGYRVRRELREVVLFAAHDLLCDSPFSRLDLIACRNLLIYLNREAQQRALGIFHFALRPSGYLFLGLSETVDDGSDLFSQIDKKNRIYRHRATASIALPVPAGRSALALALAAQQAPALPSSRADARSAAADPALPSWSELHFRVIEHLAPPSVLVNHEHEIVHLSENAGRFLRFVGGQPTRNLLRAVHPMLRVELRAALYRVAQTGQPSGHVRGTARAGRRALRREPPRGTGARRRT